MSGKWIASYRLQLHAGFPLAQAQVLAIRRERAEDFSARDSVPYI